MLIVESRLIGKDTSGLKIGKCIHVYRGGYTSCARVGDFVLVSVRSKDPHKKLIKNKLLGVVVTTRKDIKRLSGHSLRFQSNGLVVMQDRETFKSKKIRGPVSLELKYNKITRPIVSVSRKSV
jgi:large subunit ribosomal protein L14